MKLGAKVERIHLCENRMGRDNKCESHHPTTRAVKRKTPPTRLECKYSLNGSVARVYVYTLTACRILL